MSFPRSLGVSAAILAAALCSCQARTIVRASPEPDLVAAEPQSDLGVELVAAIENADVAIAHMDRVAAGNDIDQARSFARRLMIQPSILFIDGGGSGQNPPRSAAQMSSFGVLARIAAAQGALADGDTQHASAELHLIEASVRRAPIAPTLALLRARQGLDAAANALATGRRDNALTQLASAREALGQYPVDQHAIDVQDLSRRFDGLIAEPARLETMPSGQLRVWSAKVDGLLQNRL